MEKLKIEHFVYKNINSFKNYPFNFKSYEILLKDAYTPEQVSNLRYYLWLNSQKCSRIDIERVNNIANSKLKNLINKQISYARNLHKTKN